MPDRPSISFVMPAYNAGKTVEAAIASIYTGNFLLGDELIVVEDASTDATLTVLRRLAQKLSFTLIVNGKNRGCPASRNIGIRRARHRLIFNLDADDILVAGSVMTLASELKKRKADVAAFGESWFFQKTIHRVSHKWIYPQGMYSLADFFMSNKVPGGNFLYRKKVWEKIGRYDEYGKGLHEFWGFCLKLLAHNVRFLVIPHTHYYHRYGHASLFRSIHSALRYRSESARVSRRMMAPYMSLLTKVDQDYVLHNMDWFDRLAVRPLRLASGLKGRKPKEKRSLRTLLETFFYILVVKPKNELFSKHR